MRVLEDAWAGLLTSLVLDRRAPEALALARQAERVFPESSRIMGRVRDARELASAAGLLPPGAVSRSDLDVDAVLDVLGTVNDKYPPGSPEDEALRAAAVALLYVRDIQKLGDYRQFFRDFFTPAIDAVLVSRTFATREEADAWLASGEAHDGDLVRIAGEGFRVIPERKGKGLRFLRTPLPEEMKTPD